MPDQTVHNRHGSWLVRILLGAAVVWTVVPILWLLLIAFQRPRAIVSPGWTFDFSLANFEEVFGPREVYGAQVLNSVILVVVSTSVTLVIAAFAAYSLSQLHWSRRTVALVLAGAGLLQVIPPMTLVPGLFATLQTINLNGTLTGLILLNIVFNLPFAVILIKFYFDTLPGELRESAAIDGASEFMTFRKIMLPLAAPGVASVAVFTAIQVWNEFLFGLVFTAGGREAPITVGIATLIQPQEIKFGPMAAVGAVTAIPIILLAVIANRQIVAGLTRGAVKG
ncbi:carbohydrate ABC transporter permease [Kineosporiaceae bacterium SCSIO 59966]|nr:carbohydrate ABC transporter permease [Kineosporiaceae bacterium SCSIO 59966]